MEGVTIGDFSWGNPKIFKWTNKYTLTIGKFCSIAENVTIIVDGNHRPDWVAMYPFSRVLMNDFRDNGHPEGKGNMTIGNDVWIGTGVIITPGVNIGDGAVVAAGSVVTHDVLPYEVVGGVPARHIKDRFPYGQVSSLLRMKWWGWDIEKIKGAIPMLESGDIDGFINKYKDWNLKNK